VTRVWEYKVLPTEKQIAANRANAKKSTGPNTAAGKLKSSGNAYRHGLSGPVLLDRANSPKTDSTGHDLASGQVGRDRLTSAAEFAHAQTEILRIRAIRNEQWVKISLDEGQEYDPKALKRLAALDRYERYALTKRRRASLQLF
jgi:hypothetical protein